MQKAFFLFFLLTLVTLSGCHHSGQISTPTTGHHLGHQKFNNRAYNRPYEIKGVLYTPQKHYDYQETGLASYYGGGDVFHGRKTSNGERFDMNRLSAAHKTVPIPCVVLVTNLENGRTLRLKINDRGPFINGRIIDVSRKAARMLDFENKGLARVKVETLPQESFVLADAMARGQPGPDLQHAPIQLVDVQIPSSTHRQIFKPNIQHHKNMLAASTPASRLRSYNSYKQAVKPSQILKIIESLEHDSLFARKTHAESYVQRVKQKNPHAAVRIFPVNIKGQKMYRVATAQIDEKLN